ncbi:MAG: hypothetical protein ABIE36_03310 [Candidatus Diapherotrites archaeon]
MKRDKRRLVFGIILGVVLLMISGVLAESIGLSNDVKDIVKNVAEKRGIDEGDIQSIEQVNFNNLPDQIELGNIDTTNLAIYKVDYGTDKPLFVITASNETPAEYKKSSSEISRVMLLNFGYNGIMKESDFLKTATGVEGSLEKGYVMMRDGSITGLSTNLEIVSGSGNVEMVIYKNGDAIGFRNTLSGNSVGVKTDYDIQSLGTVQFEKGDVLSVYAKSDGDAIWGDVIILVEISVE